MTVPLEHPTFPGRREAIEGALANDSVWERIHRLALAVDERLAAGDARLTIGGEPTFVSATDRQSSCWWFSPLAPEKLTQAWRLGDALRRRWAPGGLLLLSSGKSYPGEAEPRWSLVCVWRRDGVPMWKSRELLAVPMSEGNKTRADAERFLLALADRYGLPRARIRSVYHPPSASAVSAGPAATAREPRPARVPPARSASPGVAACRGAWAGLALPFPADPGGQNEGSTLPDGDLVLTPGTAPIGFRLPRKVDSGTEHGAVQAVCVEVRDGHLHVFLPALGTPERYFTLLAAVEATAAALGTPVVLTGHPPPRGAPVRLFNIAPDPGVIEVNLEPAAAWPEWETRVAELYRMAADVGLDARRFRLNGDEVGTGGGGHILLGGPTPSESPFHRRPEVLAGMIAYWHNHPSLSYAFASAGVGPFSQHPRVDESRYGAVRELEIALAQLAARSVEPHVALRHILVDATGNPHRAEFCIDKLAPPSEEKPLGGLLELRAFEMQPTARMSLLVHLLVRALFTWMWEKPYQAPLKRWGTKLHDAYMLPAILWADLCAVLDDLAASGLRFDPAWFEPLWNRRFPVVGRVKAGNVSLELRKALEPWIALSELGATRLVDSSMERLQIRLSGAGAERCKLSCNGYELRLRRLGYEPPSGRDFAAIGPQGIGTRFRAWVPFDGIHPEISPHSPLVFEVFERGRGKPLIRCIYHAASPDGADYPGYPGDAGEAERRRAARFIVASPFKRRVVGHVKRMGRRLPSLPVASEHPLTADLCRADTPPWGFKKMPKPEAVGRTLRTWAPKAVPGVRAPLRARQRSGPHRISGLRRPLGPHGPSPPPAKR